MLYPYPGIVARGVQNSQKFWVRVFMSYRTSKSSGYGYECPTELTEVLCRVIPGVNTPGMVCVYPTELNLATIHPYLSYTYKYRLQYSSSSSSSVSKPKTSERFDRQSYGSGGAILT